MADNVYMPPKPVNSWAPPECCPPPQKPDCDPGYTYPSCGDHMPPPPPPIVKPGKFPNKPAPGLCQIPPIPSVCEGESLYESMNCQIERVNACISQWNSISANCFAAMNACVEAARSNDVYYDDCEVHYQEGFDENEGCAYAIVEKRSVDRQGRPIFVRLVPAYKNTTNSGVKQDIFDVSFIESANLVITAVPTGQKRWYGPAMYKGAPIPGTDEGIMHPIEGSDPLPPNRNTGYVYGFNRQGWLRYFPAESVTHTDLCQNGMVDVLGSCWPILTDNQLTDEAKELTNKASITAIGFNKGTGSVFFFSCSAQDQPGMTGVSVAKLLQGFGCTTAVITSMIMADDKTESAGMLYMGQMTTVPQAGRSPENLAYWVITKRPGFNNRFQKEIADLVQTTGQNAWKNYLLGVQIQDFDDRIIANAEAIKAEQERAMQAEQWLQENINKEVERAMLAEKYLQDNINAEVNRATEAERILQENIDAETNRAEQAEANLHQEIVDETTRATQRENEIAADLAAEKLRAMNRENEIQAALDKEIRERINADNDIINALEQEVLARRAADTALENKIDAVKNELTIDINNIKNTVNGITGGQTELPYLKLTGGTLTGTLTIAGENTVTLGRGPTEDMEAATKKYVDDAIAAGGGGGTGGDVSKEYVDQQVAALQGQITNKVSKSGDTMTGTLNMNGQKIENPVLSSNTGISLDDGAGGPGTITNLANPVNPTDAVPMQFLQQKIDEATGGLEGEFLPTAGGNMTGNINMTADSTVNFYDSTAVEGDMDKPALTAGSAKAVGAMPASEVIDPTVLRPSNAAKRLGITAELINSAREKGLNVAMASNHDILNFLSLTPEQITGQVYKGRILNDNDDMVVESDTGAVILKGVDILVQDQAGSDVPVHGVSEIGPVGEASIKFGATSTDIMGPVRVTNAIGEPNSKLIAGSVDIDGIELKTHSMDGQPEHLDINVPTSTGEVYINRSDDTGQTVPGGTGDLHVTEIESPQQLILNPASSVSVSGKQIKNLADPTDDGDAVNFKQLKGDESITVPALGKHIISEGNTKAKFGANRTRVFDININDNLFIVYAEIDGTSPQTEADINYKCYWLNGYLVFELTQTSGRVGNAFINLINNHNLLNMSGTRQYGQVFSTIPGNTFSVTETFESPGSFDTSIAANALSNIITIYSNAVVSVSKLNQKQIVTIGFCGNGKFPSNNRQVGLPFYMLPPYSYVNTTIPPVIDPDVPSEPSGPAYETPNGYELFKTSKTVEPLAWIGDTYLMRIIDPNTGDFYDKTIRYEVTPAYHYTKDKTSPFGTFQIANEGPNMTFLNTSDFNDPRTTGKIVKLFRHIENRWNMDGFTLHDTYNSDSSSGVVGVQTGSYILIVKTKDGAEVGRHRVYHNRSNNATRSEEFITLRDGTKVGFLKGKTNINIGGGDIYGGLDRTRYYLESWYKPVT